MLPVYTLTGNRRHFMTRDEERSAEHNHRFWKWVSGVLGVLLTTAIIALIGTIKQVEHLRTTQVLMGEAVAENAQWIRDWYNELRVPERDQRQDSAIEELTRRLAVLEESR